MHKKKFALRLLSILLLISTFVVSSQELIFKDGFENTPPVIISTPVTEAAVDKPYVYDVDAFDASNDLLTFYLLQFPQGMSIDGVTGEISWTPDAPGNYDVLVEVTDGQGFDQQLWTINVTDGPPSEPVPSEINPTVQSSFPSLVDFLHVGPDAIQKDVQEGAIEDHRVSVIRGTILSREVAPQHRRGN